MFTYLPDAGPLRGWRLVGTYDVVGARLVITDLSIAPGDGEFPENGITGTLLRDIRPAFLVDKIRASEKGWLEWLERQVEGHDIDVVRRSIADARVLTTAPRSGPTSVKGRTPLDADFLRQISRSHMEEVSSLGSYGAVQRLARSYGAPVDTVKGWIKKARDRGLYEPPNELE